MASDPKEKLRKLISIGQDIYYEYYQTKQHYDNSKVFGSIMKDLGSNYIKRQFGIPKKYSKKVKLTAETKWEMSPNHLEVEKKYDQWLSDSKSYTKTISEQTKNLKQPGNSEKLLKKFNQLGTKKKLDTKIRTNIGILADLNQRDLIYNSDLPKKYTRKRTERKKVQKRKPEVTDNRALIEQGNKEIYQFETKLRGFIQKTLKEYYGLRWWKSGIPPYVRSDCESRMKAERTSFIPKFSSKAIEYANFSDYRKIIIRKDNWREIYSDYFGNQDKLVEGYFIELEKIRNAVQHNRSTIDADTISRLGFFSKEITNAIDSRS